MEKVKCLVPISGGKDSQACLELALQQFDDFGRDQFIATDKVAKQIGKLH